MAYLFDYPGWGTVVTISRNPPPRLDGGPDGRSGEFTFQIRGVNELNAFLAFCAGTDETVPLGDGSTITRRVPLRHPDFADLYIDSYSVDYFGTAGAELWVPGKSVHTEQFNRINMRTLFRTLPVGVGEAQQYYTVSDETGADVQTIPGGAMVTESGRSLEGEIGLTIPVSRIAVTTYMSPNPISYALRRLVGRVNSTPFTDGADVYPEGTLRFDSIRGETQVGSSGVVRVKSFSLSIREEPWNKVVNDLGEWEYAYSVAGGLAKYRSSDLNILKSS